MAHLASRSTQSALHAENEQLRRENRVLKDEVASLRQAFSALNGLVKLVENATADIDEFELLDTILQAILHSIEASDGSVLLIDSETSELVFATVSGRVRDRLIGHRLPADTGIAGWVAQHNEPVIVPNVNLDPRFSQAVDRQFQFKTHSLICVPMNYDGRPIGVIQGINKLHGKSFTTADLTLLQMVAHIAAWSIVEVEKKLDS